MAWKELEKDYQRYQDNRATLFDARKNADSADPSDAATRDALTISIAEQDRAALNRLLYDIAGSLDSLSFCYRKILEMQEQRSRPASQPGPARR